MASVLEIFCWDQYNELIIITNLSAYPYLVFIWKFLLNLHLFWNDWWLKLFSSFVSSPDCGFFCTCQCNTFLKSYLQKKFVDSLCDTESQCLVHLLLHGSVMNCQVLSLFLFRASEGTKDCLWRIFGNSCSAYTKTSKMFVIPKINEMMSWVVTFAALWSSSATSPSPRFPPVHYVKRGFFSSQLMCSWYDLMIYLWTIICWPYVDFQKHTIISYFS